MDKLKDEINELSKDINNLYKKREDKIKLFQKLCPHNNIEFDEGRQCYDDGEFIGYYPELKCTDCGLIGKRSPLSSDEEYREENKRIYKLLYDMVIEQRVFGSYFTSKCFKPLD